MKKFKDSIFQTAIFDFIKNEKGNLIINSVAGSGKSSTIVKSLQYIPSYKKVIFLSFNKHIAEELKTKVPPNVKATTMHSLGYGAVIRYYGGGQLNPAKIWHICEKLYKKLPYKERVIRSMMYEKLINLFKMNLCVTEENLIDLAHRHNIDLLFDEVVEAMKIFELTLDDNRTMDFTDMVWKCAIMDEIVLEKYDVIFVDECQDLNRAQHKIIKKLMKKDSRLIAVGDPSQSIYGFAGADAQSFQSLVNFPNMKQLPLSICYRCDKKIVELAQTLVPQIQHSDTAGEGVVREGEIEELKYGDWVLCRNTKPLIVLCLELIKRGEKAHIKGNDIGASIINILKRFKVSHVNQLPQKMNEKIEELKAALKKNGVVNVDFHHSVISLEEKYQVIEHMSKDTKDVEKIVEKLENIFSDEVEGIMLSTIHRTKGLENDRIFILMPELMPSKYAIQPWQVEQENNLKYVAYTRARHELITITGDSFRKFCRIKEEN